MNSLIKTANFIEEEFYTKCQAIEQFSTKFNQMDKTFELLDDSAIHKYSWDDVVMFCDSIATKLDVDGIKTLYGVPRGGLLIALILSYRTGKPLVAHPCPDCLIIEDACTTGASLLPYYNRYKIACMYIKEHSPIVVDYYYETDASWKGVKFPWQI